MSAKASCRRCGHAPASHRPYVPGAGTPGYCAACGCYQYQPERLWTRLLAWFRQRSAPVEADVLRQHPVRLPVRENAGYDDRTHLDIPIARPYAGVPRPRGTR